MRIGTSRRVFQGYTHRSRAQWRAAAGDTLDQATFAWLVTLLNAADRSLSLSDWEASFCFDFDERLKRYGRSTNISPKQRAILERIEQKIGGGHD